MLNAAKAARKVGAVKVATKTQHVYRAKLKIAFYVTNDVVNRTYVIDKLVLVGVIGVKSSAKYHVLDVPRAEIKPYRAAKLNYGGYGDIGGYKPSNTDTPRIIMSGTSKEMRAVI